MVQPVNQNILNSLSNPYAQGLNQLSQTAQNFVQQRVQQQQLQQQQAMQQQQMQANQQQMDQQRLKTAVQMAPAMVDFFGQAQALPTEAERVQFFQQNQNLLKPLGLDMAKATPDDFTVPSLQKQQQVFSRLVQPGKGPGTEVGKLMFERDQIAQQNPDDPRIANYNAAIQKATTQSKGQNIKVNADGSFEIGYGGGGLENTAPTNNKIQEKKLNSIESLSRLSSISASVKPQFLTYEGAAKAWYLNKKDKLGQKMDKNDSKYLSEYSGFAANATSNLNRTLNELSGAAVSPTEEVRLKAELPDYEKDGPKVFASKLETSTKNHKRAIIRYNYAQSQGLDPLKTGVELADVDKLLERRGREIEFLLKKQGLKGDDLTSKTAETLKYEFGLQ